MNVAAVGKSFRVEHTTVGRTSTGSAESTENGLAFSGDHAELSAQAKDVISGMRKKAAQKRAEIIEAARKIEKPSECKTTVKTEEIRIAFAQIKSNGTKAWEQAKKYISEAAKTPPYSVMDDILKSADSQADDILNKVRAVIAEDAANSSAQAAKTDAQQVSGEQADDREKTIADMLQEQQDKIENMFSRLFKDDQDHRINSIRAKMRNGLRLSVTEQAYLSVKNPDMYERYQAVESARKSYRSTLNSCRTKDQVNGMQLSNALSALSHYRKALRDGGSGDDVVGLYSALNREINDFRKSSSYNSLPTNAECGKFYKDLAKAKKFEQEKKAAKRREQLEKLRKKKLKKKKKPLKTPGDGKRTVSQVMNSPTAKKVIGSMTKPVYMGYTPDPYSRFGKNNRY